MKKILVYSLFLTLPSGLLAQHLAAFSDIQNYFYIFDAGVVKRLETMKIQSYKVGGEVMAYIDNSGALKAYRNGTVTILEYAGPAMQYFPTDYLMGYKYFDFLKAFDGGAVKTLCTAVQGYVVQDSLIAWYDRIGQTVNVYYQGETMVLEDGLLEFPLDNFKSGDNILAYVTSYDNKFKVFYNGDTWIVDDFGRTVAYKAGKNIVAYMDIPRNIFKVFYKGEVFELEYFAPRSFETGDDMVAYVDDMGNFKLWDQGITFNLLSYAPDWFEVKDRILVFSDKGYLKTFCDGRVQTIEPYIPQKYAIDWSTIAYIDENRNIRAVQQCEKSVITHEVVMDVNMNRNLILYKTGANTTRIYYFGQTINGR
jgi:hypothetical protein